MAARAVPEICNVEIYGDRLLRNFSVRYSDALAAQGANVRYMTYMHSVLSPGEGVPHCAELPMLFSTYALDYYRTKVGAGAAEDQLARHWTSAVATFAKNTAVVFADGSAWPLYATNTKSSVQMGRRQQRHPDGRLGAQKQPAIGLGFAAGLLIPGAMAWCLGWLTKKCLPRHQLQAEAFTPWFFCDLLGVRRNLSASDAWMSVDGLAPVGS